MIAVNEKIVRRSRNGNITTYTWTDDNQLAAVALPNSGGTVTNTYDGDGLRFSRQDANGTNSYLWNSQVLEAELGSGNTVSTWYTQGVGDGNQGAGEFGDIVSTRDVAGSATSWPQYDASGNVSQTTDSSSSITTTLAYDTFGVVTDNSGPANPTVAWQGKQGYQFEQPLGLQYVRQRWYDPATRQFISPDPLGFGGGDVNLFRYAGNNPINRNDPGGMALEYVNHNLFWKVHPDETAWGIAQRLTGHGAWYRKIFQRPPNGFSHLYPGELLSVDPANIGLIANHHWIAEPGQPAGPMVLLDTSQSHLGQTDQQNNFGKRSYQLQILGNLNKIGLYRRPTKCIINAMKKFRQGLMNLVRQYNQEVGDFQLHAAIQHEIQVRNQVRTQLVIAGVSGITTAGLAVAADALDTALAASAADQRAIIGEAVGAYQTGNITSEELQAAVSVNANIIGTLNTARSLLTPVRATVYGVALSLTSYLAGGDVDFANNALDAAVTVLPHPYSSLLEIVHAAAVDALLRAKMETTTIAPDSGRAFGFLARGLNLLVTQFANTIKNCGEYEH